MKWFNHTRSVTNQILRLCQVVGATACIIYYGRDIDAARRQDKYMDSRWMYALVVASMSLVTSFICFVGGFFFEFRAIAILWPWDLVLGIMWTVVAGIFGKMYLTENPEMDVRIEQMKVAAGFDLANMFLWLFLSAPLGIFVFTEAKADWLHRGRSAREAKAS